MTELREMLGTIATAIEAGRLTEAEQLCLSVMDDTPPSTPIRHALGIVFSRQGRLTEAMGCFDRVLQDDPRFAPAALNRGNALQMMGRPDQALTSFDHALALRPDYPAALCNRAGLYFGLNRYDDALADYDAVLALSPANVTACIGRGNVLRQLAEQRLKAGDQGEFALLMGQARDSYGRAIDLKPGNAETYYSLAMTLHRLDQLDDAIRHYRTALRLQPALAQAYSDMGVALFEAGQPVEASANLDKALAIAPENPEFLWNKSLYLLAQGEFEEGWTLYESRLRTKSEAAPPLAFGWLNAVSLQGKTVRIWAEQGLGDTIQFSRFVPLIARRGAKVVFHVPGALARLLSGLDPPVEVIASADRGGAADYDIPLASLPFCLGTSLATIPADVPYLWPDDDRASHWKNRLGDAGFKVGVAWQGGTATKLSAARSFPPGCLVPLSAVPGVRLISLQKKAVHSAVTDGTAIETLGPMFDAGSDAFLDSAAVIQNLDLVITSDTAIAHLAGALGRPVWLALKQVPDWRWLLGRADSPWYPTMTLFRQERRGDWAPVFDAMKLALERRIHG